MGCASSIWKRKYTHEEIKSLEREGQDCALLSIALSDCRKAHFDPEWDQTQGQTALQAFARTDSAIACVSDGKPSQTEPPEVESPTSFTEDAFLPTLGEQDKYDITGIEMMGLWDFEYGEDMFYKEWGLDRRLKPIVEVSKKDFVGRIKASLAKFGWNSIEHCRGKAGPSVADILGTACQKMGWKDHPGNCANDNSYDGPRLLDVLQRVLAVPSDALVFIKRGTWSGQSNVIALCTSSMCRARVRAEVQKRRERAKKDFEGMVQAAEKAEWEGIVWTRLPGRLGSGDRGPCDCGQITPGRIIDRARMTLRTAKMKASTIPECRAFYFRTLEPDFDERLKIPVAILDDRCFHPSMDRDEYGSVIFEIGDYIFDPDPCHHYPSEPRAVCYLRDQQRVGIPSYWGLNGRSGLGAVPKTFLKAAQLMINETWKQKKTRDRQDAMPTGLRVLQVERNENVALFKRYQEAKRALKARRPEGCAQVNELDDDPEHGFVKTVTSLVEPYKVVDRDTEHGWMLEEGLCTKEDLGVATYSYRHYVDHLDTDINEVYLFHGTSVEGSSGICSEGFRLDLAGSHVGTMFGNGAYFAEASSKADEYVHAMEDEKFKELRNNLFQEITSGGITVSIGDRSDAQNSDEPIFVMLLCRVLAGEILRVTKSDHEAIQEGLDSGKYDSVLGDREASVGTYREFVAFNGCFVYPEYKIFYERIWPDDTDPVSRRRRSAEEADEGS